MPGHEPLLEDEDAEDLLAAVEMELRRRRFGRAVRLEIEGSMSEEVRARLDAIGDQVLAGERIDADVIAPHDLERGLDGGGDGDLVPGAFGRVRVSHVCLNDDVVEGLELRSPDGALRSFSVQYHPEASPGPHDISPVFDRFMASIEEARSADNVTVLRKA